ncbi:MAG: hypothetical protein O3B01_08350 [Planctomycetota bacterium]|nr:hypothetical protein [Planctomycetota bacterium]MDA1138579.1 hypothetical protein [Planctomycetota bacterium]
MKLEGKRVRLTRFEQSDEYKIAAEVDAVIPRDDPSETSAEIGAA